LLIEADSDWSRISSVPTFGPLSFVFREDTFDAVTRVRRGRIYQAGNTQPVDWHVQTHPAYDFEVGQRDHGSWLIKKLDTFHIYGQLATKARGNPNLVVAIGTGDAVSLWSIVSVERNFVGEDFVTLRARSTFGVLPALANSQIPRNSIERVSETVSKVADAAFRESSISVIDRCRDAAQVILGAWLAQQRRDPKLAVRDLSDLVKQTEKHHPDRVVLCSAAKILARLHARGKPNEQLKRKIRTPNDADAEVAIGLVGTILREVGWTPRG